MKQVNVLLGKISPIFVTKGRLNMGLWLRQLDMNDTTEELEERVKRTAADAMVMGVGGLMVSLLAKIMQMYRYVL